jgi:hypothetical protein
MKGWTRNAVTFGTTSAVATLLLNLLGSATANGCYRGSGLGVLAFFLFVGLMGGAGFMTARGGGTIGMATLAGLGGALVSGVGTITAFVIVVGTLSASECSVPNNFGVSSKALLMTLGIIVALMLTVIGLAVGAGAGALGGLIGRRPATTGSLL